MDIFSLPQDYNSPKLRNKVLLALAPYSVAIEKDSRQGWDIQAAWNNARRLLAKSTWKFQGSDGDDTLDSAYALSATTTQEKETLNRIVAGIIAKQMSEPALGLHVRNIDIIDGEMTVLVPPQTALALRKIVPGMRVGEKDSRVVERNENVVTARFR